MQSIVADICTMAVVLGAVLYATVQERKEYAEKQKQKLCDHCAHLKQKYPLNSHGTHYICSAGTVDEGYINAPEYCRDFEERRTNDSNLDT